MREIMFFVEDVAHRRVIGTLVKRMAEDQGVDVQLDWRSARHGYGKVAQELKEFMQALGKQAGYRPDLVIVATDANCKGVSKRKNELDFGSAEMPVVFAIPDPHIERWLLLDGEAFKTVFGEGCQAPDKKCDRNRYKERLSNEIRKTGRVPPLGGIEFAEDIVNCINIERASQDRSFGRFVSELRGVFQQWK